MATETRTTRSGHVRNGLVTAMLYAFLDPILVYKLELSAGLTSMGIPAAAALLANDCRNTSWSLLQPANSLVVITTFKASSGVPRARIKGYVAC